MRLPYVAQFRQASGEINREPIQLVPGKPVILPHFRRTVRTVQVEHGFVTDADNVHMRGPVVVRINCHA
jgi:hypothetical protein